MARIAGVDVPRDKRIEIALTYIYGIGPTTAKRMLSLAGVPADGAGVAGCPPSRMPRVEPTLPGVNDWISCEAFGGSAAQPLDHGAKARPATTAAVKVRGARIADRSFPWLF